MGREALPCDAGGVLPRISAYERPRRLSQRLVEDVVAAKLRKTRLTHPTGASFERKHVPWHVCFRIAIMATALLVWRGAILAFLPLKLQLSQIGMVLDLQLAFRLVVLLSLEFGGQTRHIA